MVRSGLTRLFVLVGLCGASCEPVRQCEQALEAGVTTVPDAGALDASEAPLDAGVGADGVGARDRDSAQGEAGALQPASEAHDADQLARYVRDGVLSPRFE